MTDVSLLAIVGSLRSDSVNAATARAAARVASAGVIVAPHSIADLPLYNGDVEDAGLPASVQALHDSVAAADGLLLFSPEYNSSFPAVTKNVIDWLSRPPKSWDGKAISLVSTTPGGRAGLGVREHFSAIIERQPVRPFETLGIGQAGDRFTDGELSDREALATLADYVSRFAEHARTPQT